jgi:hypothetical protein
MLPWHWVQRGLWLIGAAVAAWVVYIVAHTALSLRRLQQVAREAAAVPMPCPACGGAEHDYKCGGLWDGNTASGCPAHGTFGYGACKGCGSRWAQWDDAPPYVPPDEEWDEWVTGPEERQAERLRQWTEHHARRTDSIPQAGERGSTV